MEIDGLVIATTLTSYFGYNLAHLINVIFVFMDNPYEMEEYEKSFERSKYKSFKGFTNYYLGKAGRDLAYYLIEDTFNDLNDT